MLVIQLGIIIFLILLLIIITQDEYRKRGFERKTAKLNRFWNKNQERRKSLRIDTAIDVLYEIISGKKVQRLTSMSRNISLGGLNLVLNEKLFPGTALQLQLNIPDNPKAILTQGEVVWVREIAEKFINQKRQRAFATGIKFTKLSQNDEAVINNFINKRIRTTK